MEVTAPNPVGRPSEYRPEFCELVEELGAQGKSKIQMAAACGVSKIDTIDYWCAKFPEFSDAFGKAMILSQAFWEEIGREGVWDVEGRKLNTTYPKQMAARFPKTWREQTAVELDAKVQMTTVEAKFAERTE